MTVRRTARSRAKIARRRCPPLGISCPSSRNGHAKINSIKKPARARKNRHNNQGSQRDGTIFSESRFAWASSACFRTSYHAGAQHKRSRAGIAQIDGRATVNGRADGQISVA